MKPYQAYRLSLRAFLAIFGLLSSVLLLSGCGVRAPVGQGGTFPTPTIPELFAQRPTSERPGPAPTRTPQPTLPAGTQPAVSPDPQAPRPIAIYDDGLRSGWTLENSFMMLIDLESDLFVQRGNFAIAADATNEFSTLYFTLEADTGQVYRREDVVALRFQLSGGADPIANSDLAVAIVGSNAQNYWIEDDNSVEPLPGTALDAPTFSETRLEFLNINLIPAGEWVEVLVWLDDLLFEPEYTYVTGFYLKTDGLPAFHVDQVELLLRP